MKAETKSGSASAKTRELVRGDVCAADRSEYEEAARAFLGSEAENVEPAVEELPGSLRVRFGEKTVDVKRDNGRIVLFVKKRGADE